MKCFNCEYLMRKFCGKPANEKLFETEAYACSVKNLTLSYSEMIDERGCDLFQESKRWVKM